MTAVFLGSVPAPYVFNPENVSQWHIKKGDQYKREHFEPGYRFHWLAVSFGWNQVTVYLFDTLPALNYYRLYLAAVGGPGNVGSGTVKWKQP